MLLFLCWIGGGWVGGGGLLFKLLECWGICLVKVFICMMVFFFFCFHLIVGKNLYVFSSELSKFVCFLWHQVAIMAVGASAIVGWPFAGALG